TELGAAVRPYLVEVQQQSQQAKKLASSLIELKGTRLKLGIMCTIGPANFVGLLSALQAQYSGIELEIFDAGAPDLQERLLEGALEAAIYCWPDQIDERLHYLEDTDQHDADVKKLLHGVVAGEVVGLETKGKRIADGRNKLVPGNGK